MNSFGMTDDIDHVYQLMCEDVKPMEFDLDQEEKVEVVEPIDAESTDKKEMK